MANACFFSIRRLKQNQYNLEASLGFKVRFRQEEEAEEEEEQEEDGKKRRRDMHYAGFQDNKKVRMEK